MGMVRGGNMITRNPYSHTNVIKPGHMPEPLKPVHTCDSQEIIDICLECPVYDGCHPEVKECPLNRRNKRAAKMLERDERILYLLTHGWRNTEAICEKLGISSWILSGAKKRLRKQGKIP